ncbi:hypothetical protein ACYULU_09810 [Breznakiellaceae bacterium SP9]
MIHYDIPKPAISPDFTIEDIHKIRGWNYEQLKDATVEERLEFYNSSAKRFQDEFANRRQNFTPTLLSLEDAK